MGVAGVGGGVLFGLEQNLWLSYWWLTLASGTLMMAMDMIANPAWIVQVRGLVVLFKFVLILLLGSDPYWDRLLLFVIIIISAVISHAPGSLRYYSLYHRRVITSENDVKG